MGGMPAGGWRPYRRRVIVDPSMVAPDGVALDALRHRPAALTALMDTLAEGALVQDAHGAILYANVAAQLLLGVPADELVARSLPEVLAQSPVRADGEPMGHAELPSAIAAETCAPVVDVLV